MANAPEHDAVVSTPSAPTRTRCLGDTHIEELLHLVIKVKASDLHIAMGLPPVCRVRGKLLQAPYDAFTPEQSRRMIYDILSQEERRTFESTCELDFIYTLGQTSRFRGNVFYDRGTVAAAFHTVPFAPALPNILLPPVVQEITNKREGLILVGGPCGSGKSTTIAAMVNAINSTRSEHIVIIEHETTYSHMHKRSLVHHREVGYDCISIKDALQTAVQEQADVLVISRLASLEEMKTAITYAGQGHLVLAAFGANQAVTAIKRFVEWFPPTQQPSIRRRLAESLQGIICQQMVPTTDTTTRICAREIMIPTPEIRALIHAGDIDAIQPIMESSSDLGMQTMDQCLFDLYAAGTITQDMAVMRSMNGTVMREMMRRGTGQAPQPIS